jgi:hypothetical protein
MFVMVLAIATSATALKYADDAPNFAGCPGSASVFWELEEDGCMPTTNMGVDPWYYDPDLVITPTFGSRHWDDPTDGSGWGGSYDADPWTWSNGIYTVLAEDSFNQPVPERGEDIYLRQYFQIVHTMVPGLPESDYKWPIGLGLELWDLVTTYEPDGWTGCPTGYETWPAGEAYGYLDGYEQFPPDVHYEIPGAPGWFKSIWIYDFSEDGTVYSSATEAEFPELFEATHTACIIGMDFDPDTGETFQIEELTLDFIWFSMPDRSDIPTSICFRPGATRPPLEYSTVDMPIYEPMDIQVIGPPAINGPCAMGPLSGEVLVHLAWQPNYMVGEVETDYTTFNVTVVLDPDPNSEASGNTEFDVTHINNVAVAGLPETVFDDANQNATLTFTQADFTVDQSVTLAALQDTSIEGNTTRSIVFTVTIDVDDPNFGSDPCQPVTMTKRILIVDNDLPQVSGNPYEFPNLSENNPDDPCLLEVRLSHKPANGATVYVYVTVEGASAITIDPNFVQTKPLYGEPNRLTFIATDWMDPCVATRTSSWHKPQTIRVYADDDKILTGEGVRYPEGEIVFTPFSEDVRYLVETLNPDGTTVVQDPCVTGTETSDGIGAPTSIDVIVEDNECGARGLNPADISGGGEEGDEPDCNVGLADIAVMFSEWRMCTYPYDGVIWGQGLTAKSWDECNPLWVWEELAEGEEEEEEE